MRLFIILNLFFLATPLFSQVDGSITIFSNKKDSTKSGNLYYTDQTDKLLLKFTNSIKYTKLDIINTNTNKVLKLAPAGSLDLAFNYRWLGLGFSFGLPSGAHSDSTKGKTKRFDLQLSMYTKKVVVDALYQTYKGFHLSNPADFNSRDSNGIFPQYLIWRIFLLEHLHIIFLIIKSFHTEQLMSEILYRIKVLEVCWLDHL